MTDPPPQDRVIWTLRALGRRDLPADIAVGGRTYRLLRTLKHDFFAATGLYGDGADRVVLKVGRTEPFFGFPLLGLGRWLRRRETRFYARLADLPNVPALLGTVGPTGFVHRYVPGQPLSKDRPVPDGYFARLQSLLAELHRRQLAYVDTEKPENILVGEDGRPHLIDFQVSWDLHELGDHALSRWILRRLQREDAYHILKHKRRLRPDEMTSEEEIAARRKSAFVRLHRLLTRPYFALRRRLFKHLRRTGRVLPEESK